MTAPGEAVVQRAVTIPAGATVLHADLGIPARPRGVVLFAHGSGSSRHSPRNRAVAEALQTAHFATLLLDLLTVKEERLDASTGALRFDIPFLAARLVVATQWIRKQPALARLPIGYFGASTGAAAALVAAAELGGAVHAIVSRGGRPDMAGHALGRVHAPTLLIVGGYDQPVLDLNRDALARMHGDNELQVVHRAGHLFEEPGAMLEVIELARGWFALHLASDTAARRAGAPAAHAAGSHRG